MCYMRAEKSKARGVRPKRAGVKRRSRPSEARKRAEVPLGQRRRVNVRELRQNLSRYLKDVKAGEAIEVAERGEPVAMLVPLRPDDPLADLIAAGKIIPARLKLSDIGPPLPAQPGPSLSEILDELREDRI